MASLRGCAAGVGAGDCAGVCALATADERSRAARTRRLMVRTLRQSSWDHFADRRRWGTPESYEFGVHRRAHREGSTAEGTLIYFAAARSPRKREASAGIAEARLRMVSNRARSVL